MKTAILLTANEHFHKTTVIDSELKLIKEIKEFTGFFGAADISDTMSDLISEYLNPEGKSEEGQYSGSHLHNMVFTATKISAFLVKLETLYDRYIHFHPEKLEEIKSFK
jgi:hypothetical protein